MSTRTTACVFAALTAAAAIPLAACLVGTDGLSSGGQMDTIPFDAMVTEGSEASPPTPPGDAAPVTDSASPFPVVDAAATDGGSNAQMDAGPALLPYDKAILADNPTAYWPLDEAAGNNVAIDVVGGRAASAQGTVTFGVAGVSKTAVRFTSGSALNASDFFDLLGQDPFAIELWMKADTTDGGYQDVMSKRAGAGQNGYVIYGFGDGTLAGSKVQFEEAWATDAGGATRGGWSTPADFASDWIHVVVTLDETATLHVYANGVETPSKYDAPGGPTPNAIPLTFGAGITGEIDEIALYNHTLSAVQVNAHFQARPR